MPILFLYYVTVFLAPQLWIEPFVGLRPDLFLYGIWLPYALFAGRKFLSITTQDRFFLLMLGWMALTIAVNGIRPESDKVVLTYIKFFLLYKLVGATVWTPARLRTAVKMLLFFALVLAAEGIQQMHDPTHAGWAGQTLGWIDPDAASRIPGRIRWINIFDGPGVFCVVFTTALPFALQYAAGPFPSSVRILGVLLLAPIALASYYTGSRGGLLASLGVLGLYTAIRMGIRPLRILAASLLMMVLFLMAPAYMTTMNDQSRSASNRIDMWAEGIEMVQQNPVFGIGKGNFATYTNRLVAHNSAIEIMGETGLPGLFLWFGLLYMSAKNVVLYARQEADPVDRSYATALGLSLAGFFISSMFVTLEYETLYMLLGLCSVAGHRLEEPGRLTRRDMCFLGAATVAWFVLIKAFVMMF